MGDFGRALAKDGGFEVFLFDFGVQRVSLLIRDVTRGTTYWNGATWQGSQCYLPISSVTVQGGTTWYYDNGGAGCDSASSSVAEHGPGVNGLCSSAYDLCVGGSEFNDIANPGLYWSQNNAGGSNASALGYIPEQVWNESSPGLWAGGGGRSTIYGKPAWQSGKGVPPDGKRDVPDLSLTAAGHDGYLIFMNGTLFVVGGTSATPSLASILALVAQSAGGRLGLANPTLYALAGQSGITGAPVFHDITLGNNSVPGLAGFSAGAGYDLASGLGSVDANALVANWPNGGSSPAIQLTLSSNSVSVAAPASVPITVKVAGSGGLNAAVTLTASGLPKGISAAFSPASIAAPGSGKSTMQVTVASTVAAGSYSFSVAASSGSHSSTAAVTVSVAAPALTVSASATSITLLPAGGQVPAAPPGVSKTLHPWPVGSRARLVSSVGLSAGWLIF